MTSAPLLYYFVSADDSSQISTKNPFFTHFILSLESYAERPDTNSIFVIAII